MKFLKKLFHKQDETPENREIEQRKIQMEMEDLFVHHFIEKGGRFLYCPTREEVSKNLIGILDENKWTNLTCLDVDKLSEFTDALSIEINTDTSCQMPIFTRCEYLISNSGSILMSSNQLKGQKLPDLSDDFIVFAKTSQFVKNMGSALSGIKNKFKNDLPTNICAIKNYTPDRDEEHFMSSENSNTKNLYLLLFEDL